MESDSWRAVGQTSSCMLLPSLVPLPSKGIGVLQLVRVLETRSGCSVSEAETETERQLWLDLVLLVEAVHWIPWDLT